MQFKAIEQSHCIFSNLGNTIKTLLRLIHLLWQNLIEIESTTIIPVLFPKQTVFSKNIIGMNNL